MEDQVVELHSVRRLGAAEAVVAAVFTNRFLMIFKQLPVVPQISLSDGHLAMRARFDVDEFDIPQQSGIGFFGIVQLQNVTVVPAVSELIEASLVTFRIEEVTDDNRQSSPTTTQQKGLHGGSGVRVLPAQFDAFEEPH